MSDLSNPCASTMDISSCGKVAFLNYARYVIMDRALPDIRDGFKPVHRRILYAMDQLGLAHNKAYKKSARIVGDVIGKYHPHGDTAVYEAMVRMAQPFSMRLPLVDGQGNFGSIDGDSPAAMRYTEARLTGSAESIFDDINLKTVDFIPNYDGANLEPSVLPLAFPNLLINGVQGIAVAMACNIPPHNPIEAMTAVQTMIDARLAGVSVSTAELIQIMPAPDFPTGGQLYDYSSMGEAIELGRGRVMLRSVWEEEVLNGHAAVVVTEIPYQVNKTTLIEAIVEAAKKRKDHKTGMTIPAKVEGIVEVRDESDKDGIRLVVEVAEGFEPEIIFVQLCKLTQLETSVSYNCTVIKDRRPQQVGLRQLLESFIDHRLEVIERRTRTLDDKARERQHLLEGMIKAVNDIDNVVNLIKSAATPAHAQVALMSMLDIDETQAVAILEMRLQRLTGIQIDNLKAEKDELSARRTEYARLLDSEAARLELSKQETAELCQKFLKAKSSDGRPLGERKSGLAPHLSAFDRASMVQEEMCVMHLSERGYVRRLPIGEVNTQNRGTRGKRSIELKKGDSLCQSLSLHSHDTVLAITESGRVLGFMGYDIPVLNGGRHLSQVIDSREEKVIRLVSLKSFDTDDCLVMMTRRGIIKSTPLSAYRRAMHKGGLHGIRLQDGDSLIQVAIAHPDDQVVSISSEGRLIRYPLAAVRSVSRKSKGVTSQRLEQGGTVRYADVLKPGDDGYLATLTETGMFKLSPLSEYSPRSRGTKGVAVMKHTERTGHVLKTVWVPSLNWDIGVVSEKGVTNRIHLGGLRPTSRVSQGVNLIKIKTGDKLMDCFVTEPRSPDEDEQVESE